MFRFRPAQVLTPLLILGNCLSDSPARAESSPIAPPTFLPSPDTPSAAPSPYSIVPVSQVSGSACGDGICGGDEDCSTCEIDCLGAVQTVKVISAGTPYQIWIEPEDGSSPFQETIQAQADAYQPAAECISAQSTAFAGFPISVVGQVRWFGDNLDPFGIGEVDVHNNPAPPFCTVPPNPIKVYPDGCGALSSTTEYYVMSGLSLAPGPFTCTSGSVWKAWISCPLVCLTAGKRGGRCQTLPIPIGMPWVPPHRCLCRP